MSDEKEYITKDQAKSAICTGVWADSRQYKNIDAQPAADVEPVVRCPECEYWHDIGMRGWGYCSMLQDNTQNVFYCAHGKER